jgi:carbamoyl-phosphate synthase small subunit
MKAILALEDGSVFHGSSFGVEGEVFGEIVFNTGMTGYQEILTDPSYCGQIVNMTYPLIGNYGVNLDDFESSKPQVKGFIVRELCNNPSNWRSVETLNEYLKRHNIIGIEGIDTRALTRILREKGTMKGVITTKTDFSYEQKEADIKAFEISKPVLQVTTKEVKVFPGNLKLEANGTKYTVALMDYGVKTNIIRSLQARGCEVHLFPAWSSADDVLSINPDGIMLSNGPGDPKDCVEQVNVIKDLMGKKPIFGICLGHQLTALANDADTKRLKYGHRGCNHPVKDVEKDMTYITSQNHGYTIIEEALDKTKAVVSHRNMNDGTVEGVKYLHVPLFTVQFHPEASPGPQDTAYLFNEFIDMMDKHKGIK